MRARKLAFVAAALAVAAVMECSAAKRPAPPPAQRELQAIYDRYVRLVQRDDKDGLVRFMQETTTEDYIGKHPDGKTLTRDEVITELMAGSSSFMKFTGAECRITRLTLKGAEAVVETAQRTTARFTDAQGKTHTIESRGTSRDTWVKKGRAWKSRLGEVLSLTTLLDGKAVKTQKK